MTLLIHYLNLVERKILASAQFQIEVETVLSLFLKAIGKKTGADLFKLSSEECPRTAQNCICF